MAEEKGVWRTIRGRRVFIRSGEDLESAMKRSGKFGTKFSPEETENLRKAGREARAREIDKVNKMSKEDYLKISKDWDEQLQRNPNSEFFKSQRDAWLQKYDEAVEREIDKINEGTPLQDIANDRIKEKETTLENDKIMLEGMKRKGISEIQGWEQKDFENRIAKNEEYLSTAKTEEQTIPREKARDFINAFKTALEEEQNGYTQKVDWDGGTYEYSKDRLERMEQSGIKPLEHSYTGGGWQGTKYDSKLTTKEIAKTVQNELKKDFPDVKISRKTDYNSIDINIMSSEKDLYTSSSDIDRMSDKQVSDTIRDSIGGYTRMDDWLEKNNRKSANGTFTANDERDYLKEELETYRNRTGYRVTGDEWYLSDYGKKVVGSLNKNLNSYNYDDSDGMVDYFDTNFYGGVQIGKWDKPYVVENKKIEAKVERFKKRKNK